MPYIFEKATDEAGNEKGYEITVLVPKTDAAVIGQLNQMIEATKQAKWGTKQPAFVRLPIKDSLQPTAQSGKIPAETGENGYGYGDCYYFRASTKFQPSVLMMYPDGSKTECIDPNQIFSGVEGYIVVGAYAYDNNGNRGVSFSLEALLTTGQGERIAGGGGGGKVDAQSAFANIGGPVAAPAPAPAAPQAAPAAVPGAPNLMG